MSGAINHQGSLGQAAKFASDERRAEREMAKPMMAENISDLFSSKISVNKLAANWRHFAKSQGPVMLEGLQQAERIASDFLDYWEGKDVAVKQLRLDPPFQRDTLIYITKQLWEFKYDTDNIIDEQMKRVAHRWRQLHQIREKWYEAIGKTRKEFLGEGQCLSDDQMQGLAAKLEWRLKELWHETLEGVAS